MEAEPTVIELLGHLMTRSFNVGPEPVGDQDLSNILQAEKGYALQSTAVPSCDSAANEKAEDRTILNIQRLIGTIDGIGNVVESVETNLQDVHTDGIVPPPLIGSRTGQHVQDIEKTANVSVMTSRANIPSAIHTGHLKVSEGVNLCDQGSERRVTSITDSTEKSRSALSVPNNNHQSTLPAFLSTLFDSGREKHNLSNKEKTSSKSLVDIDVSLSSLAPECSNRGHALSTHVAHIAYGVNPSIGSGHTYAMQKYKMEDLIAKPYMCGICGHAFDSTSKLLRHVTVYHSVRPSAEGSEMDRSHYGDSMSDLLSGGKDKGETSVETEETNGIGSKLSENPEQRLAEDESSTKRVGNFTLKDAGHHGISGQSLSVERKSKEKKGSDLEGGEIIPKQKEKVNTEHETLPSVCGTSETGGETRSLKSGNNGKKVFKCEFCEDVFTSNKYRYKHRVSSHPDASFQCPGCEKSYKVTEKDKWQHHIRIHNKPRPTKPKPDSYDCGVCSVTFRAANAVAIHMQRFHPETVQSEKPFCCEICGNLFRTRSALKSHQTLVHSDVRPFQCGTCRKVFKKESYLKLHQRTHTGEKPYMCKYCDKTFPSTTGRRCHERTHTNEKPYICSHCGNSFRAKPQLVEHERTHTLERPFVCEICGKSFASRTSIKTHKFLHTGRKPHKCSSCSRTFAQKSNLMDHFRSIHSQEKPYHCTVCDAKFTRSTSRKLHMEKKHGLKITVRQGRPPIHESNEAMDSIVASCLSIDVSSVLTPTEQATLGDTFSIVVNNPPY